MKWLVASVILALAVVASSEEHSIENLDIYNYHWKHGIPRAREIQKAEESQTSALMGRIVGGNVADISEHPYQIGLVIRVMVIFTSVCGAVLISDTRAVTAAHCQWDGLMTANSFTMVFGSNTLFSGGVRLVTTDVTMHPQWNPNLAANDIAVMRFQSVAFTDVIQPIALPSDDELSLDFIGDDVIASGYGATSDGASISQQQVLSAATLKIVANSVCENTYSSAFVHDSTLCARGDDFRSTCGGDSGGPLVNVDKNLLIGIVSFGHRDGCQLGHPVGFARVTSFSQWVKSQ